MVITRKPFTFLLTSQNVVFLLE